MAVIKLWEPWCVNYLRAQVKDSLAYHGEEAILLQMYHPDDNVGRCPRCYQDAYNDNEPLCPVCFAPGTLVRTESGFRPIESIQVGDRVLTSDGTHQRVTETMANPFQGTAYQWRTSTMTRPVISTGEHPVHTLMAHHERGKKICTPKHCEPYIAKRRNLGNSTDHHLGWQNAENLSTESWVTTCAPAVVKDLNWIGVPTTYRRNRGTKARGPEDFELTEDFLWMIGMYLAEGSNTKRSINFALHQDEVDFQNRLLRIFRDYGYNPALYRRQGSRGVWIEVHSSILARWFPQWLGSGCQNKAIPEILMQLPPKKAWAIVQGIYDGDGSKHDPEIGQTSEILALQLAEILERGLAQPTIRHLSSRALTPLGKARRQAYVVSWVTDNFTHLHRKRRWMSERPLARVVHHQPIQYEGMVYNLEVEGSHTYVVQNALVHNCYGTGRYDEERRVGGVRQATRAWTLFTDHPVAEQYGQRGVLKPDTRQVTCEAFPLLTEHDFIARVRRWDPLTHTALSTPKFYSLQTVTQDSLRTGNRFGQTWEDVVGQTAQCSWLPPKSHGIQLFPIKGVAFPQAKISGVPVPTVTPQPDSHVIFYPVRDPAGAVIGGTAGPFEQSYTFTQQVPSATWRISHTLGHLPDVTIVVGGEQVDADVDFPDLNTVVISFAEPQRGTAELI